MFSCISNYIMYYYNYYFNSETHKTDYTLESNHTSSTLEIQDSYKLVFSTSNNSPQNIELLFYQIYSKENTPTYIESKLSTINLALGFIDAGVE